MLRNPVLATGPVFTVDIIGLVGKMVGAIQKHRLLLQALPSLFSAYALFSFSPPLFASATQAIIVSKDIVQIPGGGGVLLGILGGRVPPGSLNPHPISDQKKCNLPHPFSDLAFRQKFCYNIITYR